MKDWTDLQRDVQRRAEMLVGSGREIGMQVAAYLDGRLIVSVAAGVANESTGALVTPETTFPSPAIGKGLTSTAVHVLVERGLLDYDLRIADVWHEYARHGKQDTTLRHVLLHAAGVPALPSYTTAEDFLDWNRMCRTIAASTPVWPPGTRHGIHEWTYGWLLGEVVHRAIHRPIGFVIAEELARPLGADRELFVGVPPEQLNRVARLTDRNWTAALDKLSASLENFDKVSPPEVRPGPALANRRDILCAGIPGAASVSARGMARLYAALMDEVDGVRLISPERLKLISTVGTDGPDWATGDELPKTLGYVAQPDSGRIGWGGNGGGLAGFYPELRLAVAATKNYLGVSEPDPMEGCAEMIHAAVAGRLAATPTSRGWSAG